MQSIFSDIIRNLHHCFIPMLESANFHYWSYHEGEIKSFPMYLQGTALPAKLLTSRSECIHKTTLALYFLVFVIFSAPPCFSRAVLAGAHYEEEWELLCEPGYDSLTGCKRMFIMQPPATTHKGTIQSCYL